MRLWCLFCTYNSYIPRKYKNIDQFSQESKFTGIPYISAQVKNFNSVFLG